MIFKELNCSISKIAKQFYDNSIGYPLYCYVAECDGLQIERANIVLSNCTCKEFKLSTMEKRLVAIDKNIACFLSNSGTEAMVIYLTPEIDPCGDFKVDSHNLKKDLDYSYKNGIFKISIIESQEEMKYAQIIDLYYVTSSDFIDIDKLMECYFD